MRFINHKFLLLLLWLLCLTSAITPLSAEFQQPAEPFSTIEIPVRLSLEPLIEAAERAVPTQAGIWTRWKNWHGIKSQYRAWRGPLGISISGNVLTVQAHIRYWIKARKKVLGALKLKGSCGINEAPRQAVIGMQVRLGWGRDWTLRPEFFILPTRFLDRCEMTIANIDVTPLVEREFRKQMQNNLRDALQKLAPGMRAIQQQARRTWSLMQQPIALGQDNWLMLRPKGIALSPLVGQGKTIDTQLAVSLQPKLVTGTKPAGEQIPLPNLGYYYPRTDGLNLHLDMMLDFAAISQRLADALSGKSFVIKGQRVGINSFNLAGSEQELSVRIGLSGEHAGILGLRGLVAFDGHEQKLALQDLTFDFQAKNATTGLLTGAFHEPIRRVLEDTVNQMLSQQLDWLRARVGRMLDSILPENVKFDLAALQLDRMQIHMQQQGVKLDGTATGSVRLMLR